MKPVFFFVFLLSFHLIILVVCWLDRDFLTCLEPKHLPVFAEVLSVCFGAQFQPLIRQVLPQPSLPICTEPLDHPEFRAFQVFLKRAHSSGNVHRATCICGFLNSQKHGRDFQSPHRILLLKLFPLTLLVSLLFFPSFIHHVRQLQS